MTRHKTRQHILYTIVRSVHGDVSTRVKCTLSGQFWQHPGEIEEPTMSFYRPNSIRKYSILIHRKIMRSIIIDVFFFFIRLVFKSIFIISFYSMALFRPANHGLRTSWVIIVEWRIYRERERDTEREPITLSSTLGDRKYMFSILKWYLRLSSLKRIIIWLLLLGSFNVFFLNPIEIGQISYRIRILLHQ